MSEQYPSDNELQALSGTMDAEQEVCYPGIYESPYYTTFYKMLYRLLDVARRAGDFRIFKDGDLTFGIRPGRFFNGDTAVHFDGAASQSLADDAENYIYIEADGSLGISSSGFPTPSETPHLRLACIHTGTASGAGVSGGYSHADIEDYRGLAVMQLGDGLSPSRAAAAEAFFAASDITGTQAETLTDGSTADLLHGHDAAGLSPALQDRIAYLATSFADNADGSGTLTIQAKAAAGNDLATQVLVELWIGTADDLGEDAITGTTLVAGSQREELTANAAWRLISDSSGTIVVTLNNGGAGTLYAWANLNGHVTASGALTITDS